MEYANAAISIGGRIKQSDVEKLAGALEEDGAAVDWTDRLERDDLIARIKETCSAGQHLYFCNNDQPWGKYESTEALCRELGLHYVLQYEARGEWHPAMEYCSPDMDAGTVREWPITEIGRGPLMDAEDIQKHLDAGTLADELAFMIQVHKFPWPLEVVEDEASATL
jgi:hypothetical protein